MSTSHEPSAQFDASSHAQSPQVVVRAGKTYVCSACGTLVEIPAEVVGQLVLAANPAAEADPPKQAPSKPTQAFANNNLVATRSKDARLLRNVDRPNPYALSHRREKTSSANRSTV